MDEESKQKTEREDGNTTGRPPLEGMFVGHDKSRGRLASVAKQYSLEHW